MLTAGTLAGTQELIASWLSKDRNKHGNYFTARVPKMAAYGALISAPIGHFLIWALQKIFKGRTSLKAKILQILVSNLIVRTHPFPFSCVWNFAEREGMKEIERRTGGKAIRDSKTKELESREGRRRCTRNRKSTNGRGRKEGAQKKRPRKEWK